ncbi:platelet endothelial cell adhesion molecule isoform X3 [Toxotes jaculatrix]|uniref:platelet endothelial cell adhesion molecule isoform X3 n=2 Tax=Toxotes jaculatrix TaxID=941984 RepID=UPI001B3ADE4F|nr:platelet endothelial cell adhesion molecule isoform X3 [Toxotes jaculatrix]
MGLLLLLTSSLLSNYFHPGIAVDMKQLFTIRNITLSIEPSNNVTRDTDVTLRCKASVSSTGDQVLNREYTIYKDSNIVYTKSSSTSEDLLYPLPKARVSNIGRYKCKINIEDRQMTSEAEKLTVTGMSNPVLRLNKSEISEGEEVTATCTAHGETGSIIFYINEGSKIIQEERVNSDQLEVKIHFGVGIHMIHCSYIVLMAPETFKSERSNTATVSVKEHNIRPVLEISPQSKIYEGDHLNVLCTIRGFPKSYGTVRLYLNHGDRLLGTGNTEVNHSLVALAKDPGDFECKLEMGRISKVDTKTVSVMELFSKPTLTITPSEIFQNEFMTLTCRSEIYVSERLSTEELTYNLEPDDSGLTKRSPGVYTGYALLDNANYTCVAKAKGIMKFSETLTVRPKVSVSVPKISVDGKVVLGQPFKIRCHSENGSLPINYTLQKGHEQLKTTSIELPTQQALFTVTIAKPEEIREYKCKAKNNHRPASSSEGLVAAVIEPLTNLTLTVIPPLSEISEGDHLYLICGTKGTPPVTFRWYRSGRKQPLYTTTSDSNNTAYQVPSLSKHHSGRYHCEAVNHANNVIHSEMVNIEVRLALWKKALIGGVCLLVALVLVAVGLLYFKSKRGRETYSPSTQLLRMVRTAVSVWSDRPPEAANDEESSAVSSEPDVEYTEVVHPQPVDTARGAPDHHDYGSVAYAELQGEQPEISHHPPYVNSYQDLPVPVD